MLIDGHRPRLRFAGWSSGSQVLSAGGLAVEIEIGRERKGDSKGRAGIWPDFLFENWVPILGSDKPWSVGSHNGISLQRIKSSKSTSELIPNPTESGEYRSSNGLRLSWISTERNTYQQLAVKFTESSFADVHQEPFINTSESDSEDLTGSCL
jgi:hypothetical protein